MALPTSGPISIDLISDEFGGFVPDAMNEYYRNGGLVTANNLNVPISGLIDIEDFYGAEKIDTVNITSNVENLVLSSLFTQAQWADTSIKYVVINPGVQIGSLSTSLYACRTGTTVSGSPLGGTLRLHLAGGYIYGAGGGEAQNGGPALQAEIPLEVLNYGRIYAGGGGGGAGGRSGDKFDPNYNFGTAWLRDTNNRLITFGPTHPDRGKAVIRYGGVVVDCQIGYLTTHVGGWSNRHDSPTVQSRLYKCRDDVAINGTWYEFLIDAADGYIQDNFIRKFSETTLTASITPGGVGQGYQQARTLGVDGATGVAPYFADSPFLWSDPNDDTQPFTTAPGQLAATKDGDGGDGGNWGQDGVNGQAGQNGNYTNGQAGVTAGVKGAYINGNTNVTWTVLGDVLGAVEA